MNGILAPEFDLIETMLWEKGEYFLLDLHMKRLKKSAKALSFAFDEKDARKSLGKTAVMFHENAKHMARLVLKKNGKIETSHSVLENIGKLPVKITLSGKRTDRNDLLLYHKTTSRDLYASELGLARKEGFFDIIFFNYQGEVTEGAITNIVIRKGSEYFTPPVSSGLLAGTYREYLLERRGEVTSPLQPLKEKALHKKDLLSADEIILINSVRKEIPATLA